MISSRIQRFQTWGDWGAVVALFRGSVVRVWDRRRLTLPIAWSQQMPAARIEQRGGLVLVVRPDDAGQRIQRQRRLLVPAPLARIGGWRPGQHAAARLVGCGDCVIVTAYCDPGLARSDDLLRVVDAIAAHGSACPLPSALLVDAALLRVL